MTVPRNAPQYGDQSPIAAIATALSISALAVIRLSGAGTIDLLARVFSRPRALRSAGGNTIVYGWILDENGRRLDETLVSVYHAPASYTGEESADISCHGGSTAVRAVFGAVLTAGFRQALPGEFTFRAFVNGKLDLTRAESVMELVSSRTDTGRAHAVTRLAGDLNQRIKCIRGTLVQALAEVELNLDYSDIDGITGEGGAFLPKDTFKAALAELSGMAEGYRREKLYRDGVRIVLAGAPNAGKSSLFNRLVREERAIVTDIPGTTRDWLEGWVVLDGIPVCFIDTAGLRSTEDTGDIIERMGIEKSRRLASDADIVLFIRDGARHDDAAIVEMCDTQKIIVLWNKADLMPQNACPDALAVSAKTGEGLPALYAALTAKITALYGAEREEEGVTLGSERQKNLLDAASSALKTTLEMVSAGEPLDLIAAELHTAVNVLGEITGEVSSADILETMFRQFCVGK